MLTINKEAVKEAVKEALGYGAYVVSEGTDKASDLFSAFSNFFDGEFEETEEASDEEHYSLARKDPLFLLPDMWEALEDATHIYSKGGVFFGTQEDDPCCVGFFCSPEEESEEEEEA